MAVINISERLRLLFNVILGTYPLKDTFFKTGLGDPVKASDTPWVRDHKISTESSAPIDPVWTLIDGSDTVFVMFAFCAKGNLSSPEEKGCVF